MELRGFLGSSRRSPLPLPPRPRSQLIRSAPKCHHLPALLVTPRLPSPTGATLRVGTAISTGANGACFSAAAVAAPPSRWRVVCACGAGSGAPEETRGPSPDLDGEGMNRGAPGVPGAPGVSLREPASESPNIWRQMKEIAVFAGPAAGLWVCVPLMSLIDTMVIGQGSSLELAALGPSTVFCDSLCYVFMFLSIATSNMVATSLAKKDRSLAQRQISMLLFVAFICGLGMFLFTKFLSTRMLTDSRICMACSSCWHGCTKC